MAQDREEGSGVASLTDDEAVDIGLCYGWISGQRKALDDMYYLQKYVPRRPRSRWSQVNVRKVEELTAAGRMRPPGIAEVEAAKADGRWDAAYASQKEATVPPDLAAALAASPRAASAFESLSKTERYAVILDVVARTPETRAAHIRKAITTLEARGARTLEGDADLRLRPDAPRPPPRVTCPDAIRARPGGVAALAR